MLIVKLSTAATIEIGPVLDSVGVGVEYSGLAITDLRLVKNGTGAAMASAASITHVANGHYTLVMTTGNTDTLGTLTVSCHKTGYQMPRAQMMVVPVKVYDSIVAGSDNLEVDAIQLLGTAILTPATAGTLDVNTKLLGGATVNATTSVTIPGSSTLATTGGAVASVTGSVGSVTNAVGSVTGNVGGNVTGSVGSVVGAVGSVTGLTVANLDAAVSTRMATYAQPTGFLAATFPATVASTTNITAITGNITGNLSGSVGSVTGAVGSVTGLTAANLDTTVSSRMATYAQPTGFLAATFPATVASTTNITAGTITTVSAVTGLTVANLDTTVSSRASQTSLDTLDDYVDTEVGAIKTKTDQLTFTIANQVDSNSLTIGNNVITAAAIATDAIGSAEISAAAVTKIQSGLATPTNITAATGVVLSGVTHTGAVIPTVTTVNGLAAGVITAASIAADAITDAKVASDVTIASVTGAVGSVTGSVGSVTGAVGSVTGAVTVGTINADVITATSIANNAIDAATFAADVDAEARTWLGLATANLDTQLAGISTAVNANDIATKIADAGAVTTGTVVSGTYASTYSDNDAYWITAPVTPAVGGYGLRQSLRFDLPLNRVTTQLQLNGYWTGAGTVVDVFALNNRTGSYDQLTNTGTNLASRTTESIYAIPIPRDYIDSTGGVNNIVTIELRSTSTTTTFRLRVDRALIYHVAEEAAFTGTAITVNDIWTAPSRTLTTLGSDPATIPTTIQIADEVQTRTIAHVTLVDTTTNLTNAPTAGDLTATMKASVTAAVPTVVQIQSGLATPTNITAATGIVLSPVTHTGARIPNVTLTDTTTNLTNSATNGDLTATMKSSVTAAVPTVVQIQSGLATPTNITAGTITTVTNLTNAATAGDLTATMKSSVTAAVPTVSQTADQVWDELLSGHTVSGSTGAGLSAAGAAGDPWSTALPGSYGAGTAGKIVGDNVNATISSRASQTSLDTLDDYVDTEVGAIKTKTDQLVFTVANQVDSNSLSVSGAAIRTAVGLATANLDTQIATLATPTNITAGTITTVTNLTNAATSGDLTSTMKASVTAAVPTVVQIQSGLATPTNITAGTITTVTNLTNSATNGDLTATMKSSVTAAVPTVVQIQSGLATPTNITAGTITTVTNLTNAATSGDLTQTMKNSVTAIVPTAAQNFAAVLTTALTESYAADNVAPTLAQAIMLIQQSLHEFAISSTTRTVKKLDGSTTAATFTLDSATAPTSTTRAT